MNDFERYASHADYLTEAQFLSLERYENGRIVAMPVIFCFFTDDQVSRLHSDDWSYYEDLQEECRVELAEMMGKYVSLDLT